MEKKFSQGEWKVELVNQFDDDICIRSCEELVASVYEHPGTNKCYANAKLIASAPELLGRLNSLVLSVKAHPDYQFGEEGDEWHDIVSLAEETIKKATE